MNLGEYVASRQALIDRYNRKYVIESYNANDYVKTSALDPRSGLMKTAEDNWQLPWWANTLGAGIGAGVGTLSGALMSEGSKHDIMSPPTRRELDLVSRSNRVSQAYKAASDAWSKAPKHVLYSDLATRNVHSKYPQVHLDRLWALEGKMTQASSLEKDLLERVYLLRDARRRGPRPYLPIVGGAIGLGLGLGVPSLVSYLSSHDKTAAYNNELLKQAWITSALMGAGKAALKPFMGTALKETGKSVGKWGAIGAGVGGAKGTADVLTQKTSLNPDEQLGFGHVLGSAFKGGLMGAGGRAAWSAGRPAVSQFGKYQKAQPLANPKMKTFGGKPAAPAANAGETNLGLMNSAIHKANSHSARFLSALYAKFAMGENAWTGNQIQNAPAMSNPPAFYGGGGTVGDSGQAPGTPITQASPVQASPVMPPPAASSAPVQTATAPTVQGKTITNSNPSAEPVKDAGKVFGSEKKEQASFLDTLIVKFAAAAEQPGMQAVNPKPTVRVENTDGDVFYGDSNTSSPDKFSDANYGEKMPDDTTKRASAEWLMKLATVAYSRPSEGPLPKTPRAQWKAPTSVVNPRGRLINDMERKSDDRMQASTPKKHPNPRKAPGNHGEPMPKKSSIDEDLLKIARVGDFISKIKTLGTQIKLAKDPTLQRTLAEQRLRMLRQLEQEATRTNNQFAFDVLPSLRQAVSQ